MMWQGKRVWITGGSAGLGYALAAQLIAEGAKVLIVARNRERLDAATGALGCQGLAADLSDLSSLDELYRQGVGEFGSPQILINNIGQSQRAYIEQTTTEVDEQLFVMNYFSPQRLTRLALPDMIRHGGHVITIGSMAGKLGSPGRASYAASKHAIIGWMDCLRSEVHAKGVRVSVVNPSFIQTDLGKRALKGDGAFYGKNDDELSQGMTSDETAKRALAAIVSGRDDINLASRKIRWANRIYRLRPDWYHRIIRRFYQREF